MKTIDVRITGRVQGVWFRASCADQAERLGVSGWVENRPDGAVGGHFEGPDEAVDALVAWCHIGPPHARVAEVEVSDATAEGQHGFRTR